MAEFPAMPFWFDAYWRDTQHLTYEEHGIYLHIISLLWHAPGQRIPTSRKYLQKRFKNGGKNYTRKALRLLHEFCETDGNWFWKRKVLHEFQHVAENSEKQSDRAKSRWNQHFTDAAALPRQSHGNAAGMPPTPTPTPTKERKKEDAAKAALGDSNQGAKGNGHATPEQDYFRFGKELLGKNAGGQLTKLLKAKGGSINLARSALELAATKENPREYVAAVINKAAEDEDGRATWAYR